LAYQFNMGLLSLVYCYAILNHINPFCLLLLFFLFAKHNNIKVILLKKQNKKKEEEITSVNTKGKEK